MELSSQELESLGLRVVDFITRYLSALEGGPVMPEGLSPEGLRALLDEPLPRQGQGFEAAMEDFTRRIAANSARVGHPRFMAWTRPAVLGAAVYAEALAAALNQSVAVWDGAPAATEVELRVLQWLKEMSGYAPGAGGILTSGGSSANFAGLLAARAAADPQARERGLFGATPMTIYITRETHYCVPKAAVMMGIGRQQVRVVPVDAGLRMDPQALAGMIRADREAGLRPMAVAATLGTVSSGACDDLAAIGQVCRDQGVWLHVDGAYGGLAALLPEKRHLAAGLAEADSLTFDPHKGLFVPFEAGCALVKNPEILRQAFAMETEYLPNTLSEEAGGSVWPFDEAGEIDSGEAFHFRDYGPQLSRSFRALKIYMTLKTYGVEAIASAISREYELAAELGRRIEAAPDLELMAPVPLGIVAFRYAPAGFSGPDGELDRLNAAIASDLQRGGRVFLAGTRIRDTYALRVSFVSFRTRPPDLDIILDEVQRAGRSLQSL